MVSRQKNKLDKKMRKTKGKFVVVDGLDGVGKGVFIDTFVEEAKKDGKKVFDVHQYWEQFGLYPHSQILIEQKVDVILTSEPTFVGIGKILREEFISNEGDIYSAQAIAETYALDRRILYENLLIPMLEAGIDVYQSRSFSSSLVYQHQSSIDEGNPFSIKEIMEIPGNRFCYQHPFDHLVIPTIADAQEALRRAESREKDDNCRFENLEFQLKIKDRFEDQNFKSVFEEVGTEITYLDAGQTLEYSKQQARDFYAKNLK